MPPPAPTPVASDTVSISRAEYDVLLLCYREFVLKQPASPGELQDMADNHKHMINLLGDAAMELGEVVCNLKDEDPEQAEHHVLSVLRHLANVRHYATVLGRFMAETTLVVEDDAGNFSELAFWEGRLNTGSANPNPNPNALASIKSREKLEKKLNERARSRRRVAADATAALRRSA